MATLTYTTLGGITAGAPNTASDVTTAFTQAQTAINTIDAAQLNTNSVTTAKITDANVTAAKLDNTLAAYTGVNNGSLVARGKTIIATTESRTNTAYGTLTTPDQVASIVMPTDGLIYVVYQATWQASVAGAAKAAIFVGANQLKVASGAGLVTQAAVEGSGSTGVDRPLASFPFGLIGSQGAAYAGDATTGQVCGVAPFYSAGYYGALYELGSQQFDASSSAGAAPTGAGAGGPCVLFAAAGTYTISVQFKSSSGSVTAKNRKLWVWSMAF